MTNACCYSELLCCSAGVIINVLLPWQASCRANAIMQQRSAQGYLDWMVTKWEMFGHGWSAGFVYSACPRGSWLRAPVKRGIWRVLFHLFRPATCHQLIHKVPCRPFCSPSRSCTHKHRQTVKHKLAYAQPHTRIHTPKIHQLRWCSS